MSDPRKYQRLGIHTSWEAMDAVDAESDGQLAEDQELDADCAVYDECSELQGDLITQFRAEY